MAYPADHRNDTLKAIGSSTSGENAEILQQLVHIVVDAQATTNGKEECKNLLQKLEKNGIVTINELYDRFIKEGVDKAALDNYNGNKEQFLVAWFLPPHGPNHQLYTHKGWDYDYSREEDKNYWSALEIKQSWEVKKFLFTKTIGIIYSLSDSRAEALAVLFYNVHRLRDIQYNNYDEATAGRKKYLFNFCDEIEKYVLPSIGYEDLKNQVLDLIRKVKSIESKLTGTVDDDFWQGLNEPINQLIGSIDNSENGLISSVVSALQGK
jgi:hypothetical protein